MHTIVRFGLAATATALVLAGVAGPALAPVATAAARTPAAAPAADDLLAVSCPASSQCLAVGVNHDGFGGAGGPLAEIWNGRAWHTVTVRLPVGATAGALNGVDCLSAKDCVAVGFYDTDSAYPYAQFALADMWNGTTWTLAPLPAPDSQFTSLSGVSCVAVGRCVAVGSYSSKPWGIQAPLAETLNGQTWTSTEPTMGQSNGYWLDAVSCVSFHGRPVRARVSCLAVGDELGGTIVHPVIMIFPSNAQGWPGMAIGGWAVLAGVSCTSLRSCAVVGSNYGTPEGDSTIAQVWNGASWSAPAVTWPTGTTPPTLTAVSCATANRCVAVGTIAPYSNNPIAAALTWNGKAWTVVSVPAPPAGEASAFNAVTCRTARECVAVGQVGPTGTTNGTGLSGFWNGKRWRLITAQ